MLAGISFLLNEPFSVINEEFLIGKFAFWRHLMVESNDVFPDFKTED